MAEDDRWQVKPTETTWGPYPGDATAPTPTPQAPEIPMSRSWPIVAGIGVALRFLIPLAAVIVILVLLFR
ncbi:MAG: hypothetical protein ACYDH6_18545 [Acidimicrobiales bacterium]